MKKAGNESNRGGARPGAGRPPGQTKIKTSVSIDKDTLKAALIKWDGKLSPLLEKLLRDYVSGIGGAEDNSKSAPRKTK